MTQKQDKWSESYREAKVYTKILRRILKKLDKQTTSTKQNPREWDLEKTIELLSKVGYCLNIKVAVAHKTDIEDRLKYLETINQDAIQKHEELVTR